MKLESLAAEAHWWREAQQLLRPEPGEPPATVAATRDGKSTADGKAAEGAADEPPLHFLAPSEDPSQLGRLGPYEISEVIGHGGMGIVLKGFDATLNRYVAIKVLAPQLASSAAARRRFQREAQAAAAVSHEHVIAIHAVDSAGGFPYLVMPLVAGCSLQERIDRTGPLEVKEILRIGMQVAAGLAAAHAQGLVHRDVKPANILLENGIERVMITDFGLARAVDDASLTASGLVAGTPQYMAPEQAQGGPVDHRTDLFSLGSVMYAMGAGHSPFRAETTLAVIRRICEDRPRPIRDINPEIPQWLAELIGRLHEKDPSERFQTAAEVAELLGQCLAYLQQPASVAKPPYGSRPPRRAASRRKMAWIAAAVLLVTVGTLGVTESIGVTGLLRSGAVGSADHASGTSRSSATRAAARQPTAALSVSKPSAAKKRAGLAEGIGFQQQVARLRHEIETLRDHWRQSNDAPQVGDSLAMLAARLEQLDCELHEPCAASTPESLALLAARVRELEEQFRARGQSLPPNVPGEIAARLEELERGLDEF